jgi:hypothetical protein
VDGWGFARARARGVEMKAAQVCPDRQHFSAADGELQLHQRLSPARVHRFDRNHRGARSLRVDSGANLTQNSQLSAGAGLTSSTSSILVESDGIRSKSRPAER